MLSLLPQKDSIRLRTQVGRKFIRTSYTGEELQGVGKETEGLSHEQSR